MIFSREALLWAFIHYSSLTNAGDSIPLAPRSFTNSSTFTPVSQPPPQYNQPLNIEGSRSLILSTSSSTSQDPGPTGGRGGLIFSTSSSTLSDTPPCRGGVVFSTSSTSSPLPNGPKNPGQAVPTNDTASIPPTGSTSLHTSTGSTLTSAASAYSPTSVSGFPTYTGSGNGSASGLWHSTSSSSSRATSNHTITSTPFTNLTSTHSSISKTSSKNATTSTSCETLGPTDAVTVFDVRPNTKTTTITVYPNATTSFFSALPEFTPPNYCQTATETEATSAERASSRPPGTDTLFTGTLPMGETSAKSSRPPTLSATFGGSPEPTSAYSLPTSIALSRPTTTVITTSKNPVTEYTTAPNNVYPGISNEKSLVAAPGPTSQVEWGPPPGPGNGDAGPTSIPVSGGSPPAGNSPAGNPPSGNPPLNNPPSSNPPSNNPPSSNSPSSNPSSNNPPSSNPPSGNPPTSNPPPNNAGSNPASPGSGSGGSGGGSGGSGRGSGTEPITTQIGGVSVVVGPTQVIIGGPGGQTIVPPSPAGGSGGGNGNNGGPSTSTSRGTGSGSGEAPIVVTQNGQVFTVNPSQVIGGGSTVNIPAANTGAVFASSPTTIAGVPVQLSPNQAIISGTTYSIGNGAPSTTIVVDGQTISIGAGGLGFAATTVAPPPGVPTNMVIINGQIFSVIGSSLAVIDGKTFTYGPGRALQTDVLDGETITIGPSGVSFDGTTLGGAARSTGTQLGIAGGISVTEIGSTLAVINGMTFTIGPGAPATTTVINGHTISVGPSGLGVEGTMLAYPFNPTTQAVTAGGITYSEIGLSLVVIGGTSFTVGPGAKPTTDIYNGQTISIGPGGVGFATTTVPPLTSTPTSTTSAQATGKKSGGNSLRPVFGVFGMACVAICVALI